MRQFHDLDFVTDSVYFRGVNLAHAPYSSPPAAPRPSSGSPSRAKTFDQVHARLDELYAGEHDLQSAFDKLQAVETEFVNKDDRALSDYQMYQRDALDLQEEIDHLDEIYRIRFDYCQKEKIELQLRSARGNDEIALVPRDRSSQRYRLSPAGFPSSMIDSSAAPLQYYSWQDARSDGRVSQQLQYQIPSRSFSPIDSVYLAPSKRVRSPSPLDRWAID